MAITRLYSTCFLWQYYVQITRIIITEDEQQVYADEQQMMAQECKNKTLEMAYLYMQGSIVTNVSKKIRKLQ